MYMVYFVNHVPDRTSGAGAPAIKTKLIAILPDEVQS
jgi:hypothetical protein